MFENLGEILSGDSDTTDIDNLTGILAELNAAINGYKEGLAPLLAQQEEIQQQRKETNEELQRIREEFATKEREMRQKENEIKEALFDASKELRTLERYAEQAQRKYAQAQQLLDAEEELERLRTKFLDATAGAPWREFAADHQLEGATRMSIAEKFILADTMGLGKTLTAIAALDMLSARGQAKKVLYFTPAPALSNIMQEFEKKWAPHRNCVPFGGQTKFMRRFLIDNVIKNAEEVTVVVNYEFARKDNAIIQELLECGFDTIIGDEAHILKETDSLAYKQFRTLCEHMYNIRTGDPDRLKSGIPNIFLMTGTPILNKPEELYSLLSLVDSQTFYNKNYFLQDYCYYDYDKKKYRFRPGGLDTLTKKISNRYLRRTKESAGIKLPPQTIQFHNLPKDSEKYPEQWRAYQEMEIFYTIWIDRELGKGISAPAVIAMITRLRQCLTAPSSIAVKDADGVVQMRIDIDESQKLDYIVKKNGEWDGLLLELLSFTDTEDTPVGERIPTERVAIYSQFTEPLNILHRRCREAGIRSVIIDGHTSESTKLHVKQQMDASITPFEECEYDVVLANHRVGGQALNFTNVSQMIILDEEWNPGKNEQTYGRMDRIGQTRPNTVHVLQVEDTIDMWLRDLIEDKKRMIEGFESTMELNAAEFLKGLKREKKDED